jgi:hypothetical protein
LSILLFCYLLITEFKSLSNPAECRPTDYYKYNISTIIIILNLLSIVFRITAGFGIFAYLNVIKVLRKRKENENQVRLILEENNDNTINNDDNQRKLNNDFNFNNNLSSKKYNEKIIIENGIENNDNYIDDEIENENFYKNNNENTKKIVNFIYNFIIYFKLEKNKIHF